MLDLSGASQDATRTTDHTHSEPLVSADAAAIQTAVHSAALEAQIVPELIESLRLRGLLNPRRSEQQIGRAHV